MRRRLSGCLALGALIAVLGLVASAPAAPRERVIKPAHLANACFALRSSTTGRFVGISGDGYRADQRSRSTAAAFFWKPATLSSFLPQDQGGRLLGVAASGSVGRAEQPGPATRWAVAFLSKGRVTLFSAAAGRHLGIARSGELALLSPRAHGRGAVAPFELSRTRGCNPFPEADVGATGRPFRGTDRKGNVRRLRRHAPPHHGEPARRRRGHLRRAIRSVRHQRGARP